MALPIRASTRNRLLALAALALCAFSIAFPRTWQHTLRGTVHTLAQRPQWVLATTHNGLRHLLDRVATIWRATEELERLRQENRALREALARLTSEAHDARVRLRDFSAFREFGRTLPNLPVRVVPATVVGVDASSWRHSVVIDRGSADGLRVGTPAVWGSSIVGTVVTLRPRAATVRLLSDSRAGLKVRVVRPGDVGGDVGLLRGTAGRDGLLQLKWLHLRPASKDDLVVTSGLDRSIPAGLVAGRVVHAPQTRTHLFYDVKVRPLIDFHRLGELLLIIYAPSDAEELLEEEAK
jgi:rod shape-determining protein MreC